MLVWQKKDKIDKDKLSIRTFIKDILKKKGQIRTIRTIRTQWPPCTYIHTYIRTDRGQLIGLPAARPINNSRGEGSYDLLE